MKKLKYVQDGEIVQNMYSHKTWKSLVKRYSLPNSNTGDSFSQFL